MRWSTVLGAVAAPWLPTSIGVSPLVDPSLVTLNQFFEHEGRLVRVRGIRTLDDVGEASVHVDMYSASDGRLLAAEDELGVDALMQLTLHLDEQLRMLEAEAPPDFEARSRRWRIGQHAAVHCQADNLLSIVVEIRTGRFIRDLFATLYAHVKHDWTRSAINFGAGMADGDDDPLFLWTRTFALTALLADGNEDDLRSAVEKINATEGQVIVPLAELVTPWGLEYGPLGDRVAQAVGSAVDVIKIDIDSFDCAVLQALLRRVESSVIVLESQPVVPPPFKFARLYSSEDQLDYGVHGCSLSYQLRLLHPKYLLLVYSEHDTVFIHSRLAPHLERLPVGSIFPWTTHPVRFPVDEIDCFRRSRSSQETQGKHEAVPIEFLREWALQLHPLEALAGISGNLTSGGPLGRHPGRAPFYSLDL